VTPGKSESVTLLFTQNEKKERLRIFLPGDLRQTLILPLEFRTFSARLNILFRSFSQIRRRRDEREKKTLTAKSKKREVRQKKFPFSGQKLVDPTPFSLMGEFLDRKQVCRRGKCLSLTLGGRRTIYSLREKVLDDNLLRSSQTICLKKMDFQWEGIPAMTFRFALN